MANAVAKLGTFAAHSVTTLTIVLLLINSVQSRKSSGGGGYGRYSHGSHGGYSGTHTYPASTGHSGTGAGHTYSSSGGHSYPASTGLSGNNQNHLTKQTATQQHNPSHGNTEVHHHYHQNYHYSPPQQVSYGAVSYPVYHAQPPVYVYEYRNSGSRFDNLLTGLALYNLGRMSSNHHHYDSQREYVNAPGEICKLGIRKGNGDYEETRVDCKLMSSFIWESDVQSHNQQSVPKNSVTTTVVNVTQLRSDEGNSSGSVSTMTVTNTTVVDALQLKGQSISVTPGMSCYMIRISRDTSVMKKEVQCGILQAYAQSSWRRNASELVASTFTLIVMFQLFLYQVF